MNLADALVLVLCFPAAGALLFTLAAIEQRLTGEPTRRQRHMPPARPDNQTAPGAKPGAGGGTNLGQAA